MITLIIGIAIGIGLEKTAVKWERHWDNKRSDHRLIQGKYAKHGEIIGHVNSEDYNYRSMGQ